jgi:hypothetical protein
MRQRNGQVLVGFKCDPILQDEIQQAAGGMPVSQFLRDAIVEKLECMKRPVDPMLANAPSRKGKGGPKKKVTINQTGNKIAIGHIENLSSASAPAQKPAKPKRGK